jgi:hypothetical protein
LVVDHPAWPEITQFDAALEQLKAARNLALVQPKPEFGPVLAIGAFSAGIAPPLSATGAEEQRLEAVENSQIAALVQRRALARAQQVGLQREIWDRDAEQQYSRRKAEAHADYLNATRRILSDSGNEILNLTLQIRALNVTVGNLTQLPSPDSVVASVREQLDQKKARRTEIEKQTDAALAAAQLQLRQAVMKAQRERDAYPQILARQLDAQLQSEDDLQVAAVSSRLTRERLALLSVEKDLLVTDVASAGSLEAHAAPQEPRPESISPAAAKNAGATLNAAASHLAFERARWKTFVYDDTRSAALDMAEKRHWRIRFAKGIRGEADLTRSMAKALEAGVWNT